MTEQEIYEKAMEKFGTKRQLYKLAEECAELIQSTLKYYDAFEETFMFDICDVKNGEIVDNMMEELADVDIMMNQIKIKINWECKKRVKLERLEKLLEDKCNS